MEQILRELSEQNEHARVDRTPRAPGAAAGARLVADVAAAALSPSRPPVIRVERDRGFRTAEGTSNARAYLPAKTVAPGRPAPLPTATVHVADPRRLPTLRVPRAVVPSARPHSRSASESRPMAVLWWVGAAVLAAIAGTIVVLLAARLGVVPASASGIPPRSTEPASPPPIPAPHGAAPGPRSDAPSDRAAPR